MMVFSTHILGHLSPQTILEHFHHPLKTTLSSLVITPSPNHCIFYSLAWVLSHFSPVWLFVTPWAVACQASLSITSSHSLLNLMSIELVRPSNHLILCCPLLFLPSIFPSLRVFSNESVLHIRWPEYWSFSISPSSENSGLLSFRTDWCALLAVQGTLKSLLQHDSSKASILWCSAFSMVHLSHPYMTNGTSIRAIY